MPLALAVSLVVLVVLAVTAAIGYLVDWSAERREGGDH